MHTGEDAAVAEEQRFLDGALHRFDELAAQLRAEVASTDDTGVGPARARLLRTRLAELTRARDGLVFGRLDALDATVLRIGRIGLRPADEHADPLVVDWRAPAARPFYTATPLDAQGQARRRHVRTAGSVVLGVDDEPLDGGAGGELVGEGALLAALDRRRTGHMTSAIATLQHEQDDIIRAATGGPLIVQGGPGTGKTVVALHRVAYLLFTHRRLAEQAVLVLGPSARFLDYIAQVLPALGETAVVPATCDTLIPAVRPQRTESREAAELKGRALWQPALTRYAEALLPRARDLTLRWEGEQYVLDAATVASMLTSATRGRSYHRARDVFADQLHHVLADAVAERRTELLDSMDEGYEDILDRFDRHGGPDPDAGHEDEEDPDELRERIAAHPVIARFVASW